MAIMQRPTLKQTASLLATMLPSRPQTKTIRSQNQTMTSKKRKPAPKKNTLKKKMLALKPAFHKTVSDQTTGRSMIQGSIYSFSPTQAVTQGTDNVNRVGDSIYIEALKIKGYFLSNDTSGAYNYRIIVGFSGEEVACAASYSNSWTSTDTFLPLTGVTALTSGIVNPKAFTVLYDATIDINSPGAAQNELHSIDETIQIQTQFDYQGSASQYGKDRNLYVIVMGHRFNAALGADIGAVYLSHDLIFKNC